MERFTEIIGQEHIKEHLQNALALDKAAHAYIFHGEPDSGKEFIARIFAAALQCEQGGNEPCGMCRSCKQAESRNHPDIIWVGHEKPNSIGVEDVRVQINGDIGIKPYYGPRKIYIVNEAQKLTPQAQNALLKTLEEPPSYGMILLLATNAEAFLPTIVSRCVTLHLRPAPDREVEEYLMKKLHMPDYQAKICAAFARGNIGRAKALAESEDFERIKEEAVSLLKRIRDLEIVEIVAAIRKIKEDKLDVDGYLDIFYVWYRDILLFKATKEPNDLIFKEEIQYIKRIADRSSYEGIETILKALDKAQKRLGANVNFELTMELLFLSVKENSW